MTEIESQPGERKQEAKITKGETAALGIGMVVLLILMASVWLARLVAVVFGIMALWNWDAQWALYAGVAFAYALIMHILSVFFTGSDI